MDQSDISDAIVLFQFSQTARVGGRASDVLRRLWNLFKSNEIGFRIQAKKSTRGSFTAGQAGPDLEVNPQYIDALPAKERLAALSLVIVHEVCTRPDNFPISIVKSLLRCCLSNTIANC